jgi:8-oxo-dGTP pyrophosphatase MutT (NUDIX family)
MEITRHFTATTFIVYNNRTLLHLHKKLGIWLPVGGHIDRDELPTEAALREVAEEAGLPVQLYQPESEINFDDGTLHLHRPIHLLLENINPFHQHIDFVYYATAETDELNPLLGETSNLRWFTKEELQGDLSSWKMPANARILALEALAVLSS